MAVTSLSRPIPASDPAIQALRARPSALFTDIDGTLSPIVARPQEAVVLATCREALRRLAEMVDLVCVLSGRPADEAWRMVQVDEATYVGNHGAETWVRGELLRPPDIERYRGRLARASTLIRLSLSGVRGIVFEDKGIGFAVHWRGNPGAAETVREVATRIARRRGLQVALRTMHVEVRPPLQSDKGTALRDLAQRHGLKGLVAIGDDPVDAPAFAAAREYAGGADAKVAILTVGTGVQGGDIELADPAEVGRYLLSLAHALT